MGKKRILVVENDVDVAIEIETGLRACDYVVVGEARSGREALDLAQTYRPDLVLMDIALEGDWDGVDTARALRDKLGIAVLYLTAHGERDTLERARATLPAGYLLKPFSERELAVAVEMALLRQQLEASLSAERERLNVTLRSIGDGVIATDNAARVVLVNSVAEVLTGWKQEDAVGRPLSEVFHIVNERTREPCENPVERVLQADRALTLASHTALIARDGTERVISDSGAPILNAAGKITGAVLVFRDVTQQLKLEREIQKAQRLESVGVLAGGVAHDFNNLLTVISANVSFALRKLESDQMEIVPFLDDVLQASAQAASLTRQLLTFARGGPPVRKPTSLGELVRVTTDFALRGGKSRGTYAIADDLSPVNIDAGQISQVLTNLIINADEATPGGGVIEVRCINRTLTADDSLACAPGQYVEISVTDHGVGIAPEVVGRLFEPYFSTKQRGSGLGLATAYSIVKSHDGALLVHSRVGEGATFRLLLPVAAPQERPAAVTSERELPAPGKPRVLVMDDDAALRASTSLILTHLGHEVEAAADGAQAVAAFARAKQLGKPFDVVLLALDVRTGIDALETLTRLRAIDPSVRAIATSGQTPDPVLAAPQTYGFAAALPKPYGGADLSLLVQRARHIEPTVG